jgi:hypothetical protein
MTKTCISCKKEKDLSLFNKRDKSIDGHRNQCKWCLNEISKCRIRSLPEEEKERRRIRKNELNKIYRKYKNEDSKLRESEKRKYRHKKRLQDPLYKMRITYVRRMNKCIKRFNVKNTIFLEKLGCELDYLKNYIESRFENWMTWDNHGKYNGELNYGWDLDHVIPLSSAKTEKEFYKLCHYKNLQPLCSKINRDIKKDKI